MHLILMGAPGSGKGTYAAVLKKYYRVPHISTGEIFRDAIAKETPMGLIAKTYIDKGNLCPDDITNEIVKERLKQEINSITEQIEQAQNIGFESSKQIEQINSGINVANERMANNKENYERYEKGEDFDKLIKLMLEFEENSRLNFEFDVSNFTDFEKVKDNIYYRIVNYEANLEMLESVPHTKFLDLAKVYYVVVRDENYGEGSILINNEHMRIWGVTENEIEKVATVNTETKMQPTVRNIKEIVKKKFLLVFYDLGNYLLLHHTIQFQFHHQLLMVNYLINFVAKLYV